MMTEYNYTARTKDGTPISGSVIATDHANAIKKIQAMGFFPIKVETGQTDKPCGEDKDPPHCPNCKATDLIYDKQNKLWECKICMCVWATPIGSASLAGTMFLCFLGVFASLTMLALGCLLVYEFIRGYSKDSIVELVLVSLTLFCFSLGVGGMIVTVREFNLARKRKGKIYIVEGGVPVEELA